MKSPHVEIYTERWPDTFWTDERSGGYVARWRWRFRSSNGKVLSQSSESYRDPRDLVRGLELSHPGYRMVDGYGRLDGYGGWYLCSSWPVTDQTPVIPVRIPEGTMLLWRARRKR